jgi:hypothetical protein
MPRSTPWIVPPALAAAIALGWAVPALAANSTAPGAITTYTTIQCAGIKWQITGDDNNNCVVAVEYRRPGEATWRLAQPLWRVETGLWHHGEDPGNLLAGSIFFLDSATTYDVRLTLNDPDGGSAQQIVSVATRAEPHASPNGRVRYVAPGSGGGTGTQTDPFRGLAAADASAQPGDIIMVLPGTYTTKFTPTRNGTAGNPIVYVGTDPTLVILDGGGGVSGGSNCVDLTNRQYVHIERMTLRNCLRPVMVHATTGCVIRRCTIQPVNQLVGTTAILGANVHDLFVSDNTILMPGDWQGIGRTGAYGTGGYGTDLTGDGIIICYNKIVESWDAIDAGGSDGSGPRTFNVDIYNNLIDRASDDATQTDAIHENIRIFRNRFLNAGCATSCQPSFGGPAYFLFNEMYNIRLDPFKYHQETFYYGATDPQETSGMLAFHNTNICSKSGWYEGGYWHHVKNRNNLLLGARANLYSLYIPSGVRGDLDYDGYNRQQSNLVKYNGSPYTTLPAFYSGAGQEQHGVEVTINEFVRAPWPTHPEWDPANGYGVPYLASDIDLQLRPTSAAIDRGQVLANINDGYTGAAPDLGCYELGKPAPWYGPRPASPTDVPTATLIARFTAEPTATGVDVSWSTVSASAPDGFRLERAPSAVGPYTEVTGVVDLGSDEYVVHDGGVVAGSTYFYRLSGPDESGEIVALAGPVQITVPSTVGALQWVSAGPNPFRESIRLVLYSPQTEMSTVMVYDVAGHEVGTLYRGVLTAGTHEFTWSARGVSKPGIYWIRANIGTALAVRRVALTR